MATSSPYASRPVQHGPIWASRHGLECEQMQLSREQWDDLRRTVWERDLRTGYELAVKLGKTNFSMAAFMAFFPLAACVAWQLDHRLWGTCSGDLEFDHIHERGQTALQLKAEDDEQHLQTVCGWHHGTRRTGGGWITSADAREAARVRLEGLYPS